MAARWRDFLAAFGLPPDSTSQGVIQMFDRQGELLESLLPVSLRVARPPEGKPFIGFWGNLDGKARDVRLAVFKKGVGYRDADDNLNYVAPLAWARVPDLSLLQEPPGDVSSAPTSGA